MNLIKLLSVSVLTLVLSHTAFAARGDLDLQKFVNHANQELEKLYGANNLEKDIALFFQDGAGVGTPTIFDFATITLLRKPKFVTEHELIHRVGFRLAMNGELRAVNVHFGECLPPICITPAPGAIALGFAFPGTIIASFNKMPMTVQKLNAIKRRVKAAYPKSVITSFEAIFMLQVDTHPLELAGVVALVSKEAEFSGFDINFETYAAPFEFDPALEIKQTSGVLDMDAFRTVTRHYKEMGIPFATETTIPEALKP